MHVTYTHTTHAHVRSSAHLLRELWTRRALAQIHNPYVANNCGRTSVAARAGEEWSRPLGKQPLVFHLRAVKFEMRHSMRLPTCAALRHVVSDGLLVCTYVPMSFTDAAIASVALPRGRSLEERADATDRAPCGASGESCGPMELTSLLRRHGQPSRNVTLRFPRCHDPTAPKDSLCSTTANRAYTRGAHRASAGGICPRLVPCRSEYSSDAYCDELGRTRFSLMASGDTPSSRRMYDAIEAGVLPVILSPELRETLSPIVEWDKVLLEVVDPPLERRQNDPFHPRSFDADHGLEFDLNASLARLQHAADLGDCELERRRHAMLQWLPLISWTLDPYTTSMHMLAQAALRISEQGW
jgi:hypothetical protein